MIRNADKVREFEERYLAENRLSLEQALAIVDALWAEGLRLGSLPPADPLEGIDVDIRIARVLNSCLRS